MSFRLLMETVQVLAAERSFSPENETDGWLLLGSRSKVRETQV